MSTEAMRIEGGKIAEHWDEFDMLGVPITSHFPSD
jgi:hypothetical protein